tara:strand:- start:1892 stop:3589 length:1698 start_codon:yes stop_codon:yes gene_type:complete
MMKKIRNFSLRSKLTTALIIVSIVPLLVLSTLFFIGSEKALKKSTLDQLSISAEYKVGEIHLFLETLKTNTIDFSSDGFIKNELQKITNENGSAQALNNHLQKNKLPTQSDLVIIDVVNTEGKIVSSTSVSRIGIDISEELYFQKGLLRSYISKLNNISEQLQGIIATPVISNDTKKSTLGVLVNHYYMDKIQDLFSGELLFNLGAKSEHRRLSVRESIYMLDLESKRIMTSKNSSIKNQSSFKFETYPVKQAQKFNLESKGIWKNHLDTSVLGVSIISNIDGLNFILIAEQEIDEAFQLVDTLKSQFYFILIVTMLIVFTLSFLLAFFINKPLKKVKKSLDIIASGEFNVDIEQINQHDELGKLVNKFNNMALKLKEIKAASDHKNKQLLELTIRDHLTGLFNHRHLIEYGETRVSEANRIGSALSILMIDIDHFKRINDTYGHPCGDYVITEVASLLKNNLRVIDILARYGGEEFAVMMPNTTQLKAKIVADKLCKKVQEHLFFNGQKQFQVTISIGIAVKQKSESKIMEIIKRADHALYQSKEHGRNQVTLDMPINNITKKA